jgi:hypothetical protein
VNADDFSLEFIQCEVQEYLGGKPILRGVFTYANGRIAEIRNAPMIANWALKALIWSLRIE